MTMTDSTDGTETPGAVTDATKRNAVLLLSERATPRIEAFFSRLRACMGPGDRVFWLSYEKDAALTVEERDGHTRITIGEAACKALGFPAKTDVPDWRLIPGNIDCLPLALEDVLAPYDHVWLFESDVDFSGDLALLFDALRDRPEDLVCTNTKKHSKRWPHASRKTIPPGWDPADDYGVRVFLPFFRVSRAFLRSVRAFYEAGGDGHIEWAWGYIARARGHAILDVGDRGLFTNPGFKHRFYERWTLTNPGTFRYRPPMRAVGHKPNMLWHPVKDWEQPSRDFWDHERIVPLVFIANDYLPRRVLRMLRNRVSKSFVP
jgi:hypothetical protein